MELCPDATILYVLRPMMELEGVEVLSGHYSRATRTYRIDLLRGGSTACFSFLDVAGEEAEQFVARLCHEADVWLSEMGWTDAGL